MSLQSVVCNVFVLKVHSKQNSQTCTVAAVAKCPATEAVRQAHPTLLYAPPVQSPQSPPTLQGLFSRLKVIAP